MKKSILIIVLLGWFTGLQAQTFYLVRHAEKLSDGSKDPQLTNLGQSRAQNLAHILAGAGIKHVYATAYQRTLMTAKPLADYLAIEVTTYDPNDLVSLAETLKLLGDNVLIVGHSNTTPLLTQLISGKAVVELTETDYDYIFQVVIQGQHTTLNILKSLPPQSSE